MYARAYTDAAEPAVTMRRTYLSAILLLSLYLTSCLANPKIEGVVEGVQKDEKGKYFITDKVGDKWSVLEETKSGKIFWINPKTFKISWEDPRAIIESAAASTAPPEPKYPEVEGAEKDEAGNEFIMTDGGEKFMVHKDEATGAYYFHNPATQQTQWDDPRISEAAATSADSDAQPSGEEPEVDQPQAVHNPDEL